LVDFWKRLSLLNAPAVSATGSFDADKEAMRERIRRETEY
jgi:hypothetical protein